MASLRALGVVASGVTPVDSPLRLCDSISPEGLWAIPELPAPRAMLSPLGHETLISSDGSRRGGCRRIVRHAMVNCHQKQQLRTAMLLLPHATKLLPHPTEQLSDPPLPIRFCLPP